MGHARDVQREVGLPCIRSDHRRTSSGKAVLPYRPAPSTRSQSKLNTTHVDFGFAHYWYAIFVLHWFTSHEWDAEVRENGAFWRRKKIVCDEFYCLDRGVRGKVVAHR